MAPDVLTTLVAQTASASRSEEQGSWRYPHDLAGMIRGATAALGERSAAGARTATFDHDRGVAELAWAILAEDPAEIVAAIDDAISSGAEPEELGRAVAYAAALRITRFHTQNDHGDWDEVHYAFTAANALHQAVVRAPTPGLLRAVYHGALRIYLDRFLNVPAARLPTHSPGEAGDPTDEVQIPERRLEPLVQQGIAIFLFDRAPNIGMQEADGIQVRLEARPEQQMVDLALRAIIEIDADAAPAERRPADLGSSGDPDPADDARPEPPGAGRPDGPPVQCRAPGRREAPHQQGKGDQPIDTRRSYVGWRIEKPARRA